MTPSVPVHSRKRPFFRWMRYLLMGFLSLLIALAFAGAVYEGIESHRDRRLFHPPGRLVDIGGFCFYPFFVGGGNPPLSLGGGGGGTWRFLVKGSAPSGSFFPGFGVFPAGDRRGGAPPRA